MNSHESTKPTKDGLEFEDLSGRVISSAIQVHKTLGPGFLESIYQAAMLIQLCRDGMTPDSQMDVPVSYDGQEVGRHRLDLVVNGALVVELKASRGFDDCHVAQIISYLKATGLKVGLLLNFGTAKLEIKRIVR